MRWLKGDGMAIQDAQDLAEDLRTDPAWTELQPWALATLHRFRRGELRTNEAPVHSSITGHHLAVSEIPEFIKTLWSTNDLAVSVFVPSNSLPDIVLLHWLNKTIVVGPPNFVLPADKMRLCVQAKPGVYVYAYYR
jgi:hypothetical protein